VVRSPAGETETRARRTRTKRMLKNVLEKEEKKAKGQRGQRGDRREIWRDPKGRMKLFNIIRVFFTISTF
jgi:hypothetical protein